MTENTNTPNEQDSTPTTRSRRDVLKGGATIAATAATLTPATAVDGDADVNATQDSGHIPAPFDEMPTLEEPGEGMRDLAKVSLPPRAVPKEGPIPDWRHQHTVMRKITVPEWALEAARFQLSKRDQSSLDRQTVEESLMDCAYITERFLTPNGRDAVAVLLEWIKEEADVTIDDGEE